MPSENRRPTAALAAVGAVAALTLSATPSLAESFTWAGQTDPATMDPHANNTASTLGFLNNVYEGLVRRNQQMQVEPALAVGWEPIEPNGWRFNLREGVTFHDGSAFTAEDVLFSYERAISEQSDVASWFASVESVDVVDDYTVDFVTSGPNPLFPGSIANFMIMDKGWTEANGAAVPARDAESYATINANGTGSFRISERVPDVRTVLTPFDGWWDAAEHNITEAAFVPISSAATSVAALLTGEVDMINPVPLQDAPRVQDEAGFQVISGIEARVIMLGFAHAHEQLGGRNGEGGDNPLQNVLVRKAISEAVDVDALVARIMRGQAQPAALLVSRDMSGYAEELDVQPPGDLDAARSMLAEAGYPDGFNIWLRCPNDRYINDEAICTAIVGMLARIGITVDLDVVPVSQYWPELREGQFDMYLLGWSPGTFDAEHPFRFLTHTPDDRYGSWNFGGYSNASVDAAIPGILSELDPGVRQEMITSVHQTLVDEQAYVPMYVQPLVWGVRDGVSVAQRADNFVILRWMRIDG